MFLRKAMRYYRLWIYSANLTILIGTLIFLLAALYVTSDYRFRLILASPSAADSGHQSVSSSSSSSSWRPEVAINETQLKHEYNYSSANQNGDENSEHENEIFQLVSLSEPSLWLAYAVIVLQLGALQALGCLGAIRMRERLIQTFWYLILALILFDIIYLLYWLQRYNQMLRTFPTELNSRLRSQYGLINDNDQPIQSQHSVVSAAEALTLTHILDRVQVESQCCGVRNGADYKQSKWREQKLVELSKRLMELTAVNPKQTAALQTQLTQDDRRQLVELLHQVPLVPTSCCRRRQQQQTLTSGGDAIDKDNNNVINEPLDDSQLQARPRVPAWSPSMVVDNLALVGSSSGSTSARRARPNIRAEVSSQPPTLADVIDKRWSGRRLDYDRSPTLSSHNDDQDDDHDEDHDHDHDHDHDQDHDHDAQVDEDHSNRISGRLKSKQSHYSSGSDNDQRRRRRRRREAPGAQVSLAQLVELVEATNVLNLTSTAAMTQRLEQLTWPVNEWSRRVELERRLVELRNYLFVSGDSFRWPNELQLSYDQFQLIETFIQRELSTFVTNELGDGDDDDKDHTPTRTQGGKSKRSIDLATSGSSNDQVRNGTSRAEYLKLIRQVIVEDSELSGDCVEWPARSHFDEARIYTRGCQVYLRAWLQSSGNILFVMGFCVLTVLKFCSLILLRLEIREMIHKIRVLKGMATEYTALHELEPYLPRPSVCTQAAELTPTGVAPLTGSGQALNSTAGGGASSPTNTPVPRRLGGSFSEAVAAATAVAQQQKQLAEQQQQQHCCNHQPYQHLFQNYTGRAGSLANCARAISTKTIGAPLTLSACPSTLTCGLTAGGGSGGTALMLQARPMRVNSATICPCVSSSLSVAHLSQGTGSGLLHHHQQQHHHHNHHQKMHNQLAPQQHSNSLRSELFPIAMPRRHTAISVCPGPAALTAPTTGAGSRRGTYALVNTTTTTRQNSTEVQQQVIAALTGASNQQQTTTTTTTPNTNTNLLAEARSLKYLNQHRHSAHAGAIQSNLLFGGGATSAGSEAAAKHLSGASARLQQPKANKKQLLSAEQSATELATSGGCCSSSQTADSVPAFKRQSSGGTQSAANFSLDISPTHSMESRKSIY